MIWTRYVVVALATVGVFCVAALAALYLWTDTGPRRPRSDVPIVWEVAEAPDYENIEVTALAARVIDARMSLFNHVGLIGFTLRGRMTGGRGLRPRIGRVHFGERVVSQVGASSLVERVPPARVAAEAVSARPRRHVELEVTPLLELESDDSYDGEAVPFSVNVETRIRGIQWGANRYVIRCGNLERELTIMHPK